MHRLSLHSEVVCMALPEKFDDSADYCYRFLYQCENFFTHQPEAYRKETNAPLAIPTHREGSQLGICCVGSCSTVYPLSLPESKAIEDYIEEALSAGYIFFVEKKYSGLCPCINYRGLNAITKRYPYPLPLVPAALEQLQEAQIFMNLKLRSAHNIVRIREGDEWKTAFHTTRGHYDYLFMPFGLTNAPAMFQAFVNEILKDLIDQYVIVYSSSYDNHMRHTRTVLTRLRQHQFYAKEELTPVAHLL
ncbi:hypothetical protein QTP70_019352 [Hemibagrus guttatus]|uniref:ribonuclease H n=1 Tax=Hemibagrus guttatus TaxID=175788 RepID=A0AAE0QHH4_9TELE|nr:hypothetical protein QTP70_019352 [Hemibagrus guttatus]KAK3552963.1 hypothetical protein QTP86_029631 [Hemibagrus guttatus]